jgi:hypothetical protein
VALLRFLLLEVGRTTPGLSGTRIYRSWSWGSASPGVLLWDHYLLGLSLSPLVVLVLVGEKEGWTKYPLSVPGIRSLDDNL